MTDTRFEEFVRREHQAATLVDDQPIDWQAEKAEWLGYLDVLFARVYEYLKQYVDQGQVTINYRRIELVEDNIGPYSANEMVITIGSKTIRLEPIGTLLIGSKGRVDVVGPFARAQLLLLNRKTKSVQDMIHVSVSVNGGPLSPAPPKQASKIEWDWKIVTRPPKREFSDLEKENFLNLLLEVSNG